MKFLKTIKIYITLEKVIKIVFYRRLEPENNLKKLKKQADLQELDFTQNIIIK